jgi:hypothetical protein
MHRALPFFILLFGFAFLASHSSKALTAPTPLVKGSGSAVYYLSATPLKRYVFPTERTYKSWYMNFDQVRTISDSELASYPIGGNVTYRPGTRLVKITTDPRVYAISRPNVLRWVKTEAVATALYGTDWNKKIDDVPDAFFINYVIGAPIETAADYSASAEQASALFIDNALPSSLPTSPTPEEPAAPSPLPSSNYSVSLDASKSTVGPADLVAFTAVVFPSNGLSSLRLYFNNSLEKTCSQISCGTEIRIPSSNVLERYELKAEATWLNNYTTTTSLWLQVSTTTSDQVRIMLTNDEVRPGGWREMIAVVESTFSARAIDIYLDGGLFKGCDHTQECRSISQETSPLGTTHTIYTIARDTNGITRQSETKTLRVVANEKPILSILVGKDKIYQGETVDLSATASDDDGIESIQILHNGTLLKTCQSSTCTLTTGPWNAAQLLTFTVRATDGKGTIAEKPSTTVMVQ